MSTVAPIIYYSSIIVRVILEVCAVFGNTLVVIIYNTKRFRNQSMSRYLMVQGVFSTIFANLHWAYSLSLDFAFSEFVCRYLLFVMMAFYQLTSIVSSIISIDRFISVKYPKGFTFKNNLSFQIIFILVSFVASLLIETPYAIYSVPVRNGNFTTTCGFNPPTSGDILSMNMLVTCSLIPFAIMTVSSIGIYILLKRSKTRISKSSDLKKEFNMFKTLMGLNLFFFICNAPLCMFVFLKSYVTMLIMYPLVIVAGYCLEIGCSLLFPVHFLTNKLFRTVFFDMIGRHQVNSETKTTRSKLDLKSISKIKIIKIN